MMSMVAVFFCAKGTWMKNHRPVVYDGFVGLKVRLEEREALEVLAEREQLTISALVRRLIEQAAKRDL